MTNLIGSLIDRYRAWHCARREARQAEIEKQRKARLSARRRKHRAAIATLASARRVMQSTFVIADLETTGFSSTDEILEFAAIRVDARTGRLQEFSVLVRTRARVPVKVTELTGITNALLVRQGIELAPALDAFIRFCADAPVFFHNAGFDSRFLRAACQRLSVRFANEIHCSLKVARAAWPRLPSHTLETLAKVARAPAPTHRGLDDVRTTLHVLKRAIEELPLPAAA